MSNKIEKLVDEGFRLSLVEKAFLMVNLRYPILMDQKK